MAKTNDALTQAEQDVPLDSSPVTDDDTQTNDADDTQSLVSGASKISGQGDDDDKDGGRDIKNVRGELLRKQEKYAAEMNARFERFEGMLEGALAARPIPQGTTQTDATKPLNTYSVAELKALESQIPDDNKTEYKRLIDTAQARETTLDVVNDRFDQERIKLIREKANTEAYDNWPQLKDKQGSFYREVNRELGEMGVDVTKRSPTAVRDASNAVGMRLGLTPAAQRLMESNTHGDIGGRSGPAPKGDGNSLDMSDKQIEEISPALQYALKSGKFTKEQKERIKTKTGQYRKHQHLFIK